MQELCGPKTLLRNDMQLLYPHWRSLRNITTVEFIENNVVEKIWFFMLNMIFFHRLVPSFKPYNAIEIEVFLFHFI